MYFHSCEFNRIIFFFGTKKMNVLYVASDKQDKKVMCPGSTVCIALAKDIPENMLSIQNCDILKQSTQEIPDWLNGTPLLINEKEGIPYRGREAINKMHELINLIKSKPKKRREPEAQLPNQQNSNQTLQESSINNQPSNDGPSSLDDHFKMDVQPQLEETRSDKITEQDLQKYMELRNASPASAAPPQNQQQ